MTVGLKCTAPSPLTHPQWENPIYTLVICEITDISITNISDILGKQNRKVKT